MGPVILLAASVAAIFFYIRIRRATTSGRSPSIMRYFGGALVVAALAYAAGTATGIYVACSSPDSGNLCGLYGVFGIGPLLAGIAIFVYALVQSRRYARERGYS
jgi:hypothetical protein